MGLSVRIARVVVLSGVPILLAGVLPSMASAGSCPNEEVRAEQGAERLPDCRAFELVTEAKADIGGIVGTPHAFPDGNHVYYKPGALPLPGAQSQSENSLSTRTPSGWVTTALAPPATGLGNPIGNLYACGGCFGAQTAFTGDFSEAFVNSPFDTDAQDQDGAVDVYRLDLSSGAWSLAALPDAGPMTASLNYSNPKLAGTYIAGVSENGSHVFFQTRDKLPVAPGTPGDTHETDMLYDRTGGHTYAVGILPDGAVSQTCVTALGDGTRDSTFQRAEITYGAISPDGTNVVFTERGVGGASCGIAEGEGVYLREHNATTVPLPGLGYLARSSDGSKVFTEGSAGEVFEYDVASGVTTHVTTDGGFVASSADGSRVYYLSRVGPSPALYLWDKGSTVLIPNAGEGFADPTIYRREVIGGGDYAIATPDGSHLLFLDTANLTGYNSYPFSEAYVYNASSRSITCVSCNPTGVPPLGGANLRSREAPDSLLPAYSEGQISPDGSRIFFETSDALVPQDTNGLPDVYEWENGRVYLISSGQGTGGSILTGVNSNGNDVVFVTTDRLASQDSESSQQIYDARVDGGFPYRPFIPGCDSGQCQGPQTPAPVFGAPASATFVGLGNLVPAASPPAQEKSLTRGQLLAKALRTCKQKYGRSRKTRVSCEKKAHRTYGTATRSSSNTKGSVR